MEELAQATQILQSGTQSPNPTAESPTPPAEGAQPTPAADKPATPEAPGAEGTQAPAPETKPEQAPKEEKIASKLAALSKKERAITIREQGLSQREKKVQEIEAKLKRAKENPDEALEAMGLTYEEITEYKLKGKVPESARVRDLEKQLADDKEREAKKKQDDEKAEEARKVDAYKANVKSVVSNAGDEFELINKFGRHDLVYDVMVEMFKEDNSKVPDIKDAAAKTEKYLESEIQKYKDSKKLRSIFGVTAADPKPVEDKTQTDQQKQEATEAGRTTTPKTLTNSQSQTATETSSRPRTDEENFEAALKLLQS